jgi:iron complex outermembrane receptor protein
MHGSRFFGGVVAALLCAVTPLAAHSSSTVSSVESIRGRLVHSGSLAPIPGGIVFLEETRAEVRTASDGTFVFRGLVDGTYHLVITAIGFTPGRVEVVVRGPAGAVVDYLLQPELHYSEVVSVSPQTRDQFEAYQATSVLAGQDLAIELQGNLAATVTSQPGIAERSFGPGSSRPVIRGFDGDRIVVLEDGQRMGDLSSQSGDHGVNVNPAAASRVEVVRGPSTLLYGSNAIGGLVNVISDLVPSAPATGTTGRVVIDAGSAAREGGAAVDISTGVGAWVLHSGGATRASGDVHTPEGVVDNTQSASVLGNVGLSWTTDTAFVGGSYQYDRFRYGIPIVEEGQVELDPRRHSWTFRGQTTGMDGWFSSVRGSLAHRRYRHDEIVGGEIATRFSNDTSEFDLLATHKAVGRLTGTFGMSGSARAFASEGEEALSPPVDQGNGAVFSYQELTWPHVTLQFGARYDHIAYAPEGGLRPRSFDEASASAGILLRPTDATTLAVSAARAVRPPALEELYFFGPHAGNFAFEIGNADLAAEKNFGLDIAFRWRAPRLSGELTFFRNDVNDYIYRSPVSDEEFDERFGHGDGDHDGHGHDEFPIVEFLGADAVLQGFEGHADFQVTKQLVLEAGFDMVRAELSDTGEPLPRIPPMRFQTGARYQRSAFQAGGNIAFVSEQDRVFRGETPTDGYALVKLFASYAFKAGGTVNTITARVDNVTNELYSNHLSYIKDYVAEAGRSLRVVYSLEF